MAEFTDPPPTVIVVHPKEKRSKCSVEPLRGRPGFTFFKYGSPRIELPEHCVRLGLGGAELSAADSACSLLILDGTWRYAAQMERDFASIPVRSLPVLQTAFPRRSKLFDDPSEGLATIEALFAAHVILGRPLGGLLDEYRWAAEFVRLNAATLRERALHPDEFDAVAEQFAHGASDTEDAAGEP